MLIRQEINCIIVAPFNHSACFSTTSDTAVSPHTTEVHEQLAVSLGEGLAGNL